MKELRSIKSLLIVLVVILVFFVLKILSFIFIPLVFALFFAVLFLPFMRRLSKKKVPKALSLLIVTLIISCILVVLIKLTQLISKEFLTANTGMIENVQEKLKTAAQTIEGFFLLNNIGKEGMISSSIHRMNIPETLFTFFRSAMDSIWNIISMILMTLFFLILLLAESINVEKIMNKTLYNRSYTSIRIFRDIELSLVTFLKVKFVISALAGLGIGLTCVFFHINFPLFWGLLTFALHFVQMIGAIVLIVILSLFAFVEIQVPGILLLFVTIITGLQLLFGSVLEPIFMGKSFSINTVSILVMLMFWGYLWGVPGMILSVPITVFLKSIFEHFPNTRIIAEIMSGWERNPIALKVKERIFKKK